MKQAPLYKKPMFQLKTRWEESRVCVMGGVPDCIDTSLKETAVPDKKFVFFPLSIVSCYYEF